MQRRNDRLDSLSGVKDNRSMESRRSDIRERKMEKPLRNGKEERAAL